MLLVTTSEAGGGQRFGDSQIYITGRGILPEQRGFARGVETTGEVKVSDLVQFIFGPAGTLVLDDVDAGHRRVAVLRPLIVTFEEFQHLW